MTTNKASMFPISVTYDGMPLSIPAGEIVAIEALPDGAYIYTRTQTDPWDVEDKYNDVMSQYIKAMSLL